jgi:hypothetical protein
VPGHNEQPVNRIDLIFQKSPVLTGSATIASNQTDVTDATFFEEGARWSPSHISYKNSVIFCSDAATPPPPPPAASIGNFGGSDLLKRCDESRVDVALEHIVVGKNVYLRSAGLW